MKITIKEIKKFVDDYVGFDINIRTNKEEKVFVRWFYFYLCFKYATEYVSLQNIADSVNIKKHATVIYGLKELDSLISYNKYQQKNLNLLEESFLEHFKDVKKDFEVDYDLDILKLNRNLKNLKAKYNRKTNEYDKLYNINRHNKAKIKQLLNK